MSDTAAAPARKTFLGHPRGLVVLFLAEMWERFSYYGMRALLVLFLVQHFLMSDAEAAGAYAAYAALVYLLPIVGGVIADRWLGARKAVTIGAVLLVAGHFCMAFEGTGGRQFITVGGTEYEVQTVGRDEHRQQYAVLGDERTPIRFGPEGLTRDPAVESSLPVVTPRGEYESRVVRDPVGESTVLLAMALIVVGVGFLKANISNVVGALYEQGDQRRDAGFTLFYVGINLGSLLAKILCGWIGLTYGWAYGFGLAGIGMLLGLIVFQLGQPWLEGKAGPPDEAKLKRGVLGVPLEALFWIGGLIAVIPVWLLLQRHEVVETLLTWLAPAIFGAMIVWTAFFLRGEARSRMLVAIILTVFSVLFWMLFEQAGSSLTLMAQRSVELPSFINAAQSNLVNPLMIVLLGPLFAALWQALGARGLEPPTPYKFSMALVIMGLSFVILAWATANQANAAFKIAFFWLALTYVLHTIAELMISPIGLSMITKLSAPRVVGLMMGVWFLSSSLAHALAGLVAKQTATETVGGVVVDPAAALATYGQVYNQFGWIAVGVGLVLLAGSPLLKRMMAGVR